MLAPFYVMDPVQAYQDLSGLISVKSWERKESFSFDISSKEANVVNEAIEKHVTSTPFAICDSVHLDYFNSWFEDDSFEKWMKLLGKETVNEDALKLLLMKKRIPVDELVKIASPAVFGKGSETVYDTNVRKAFDISAERLRNDNNDLFVYDNPVNDEIRSKIENAMKPKEATWSYKLYKMHLYGPGDKFLPHRDTLHASNHIATVIVGLPISHKGGSLLVKHMDKSFSINLSNANAHVAKYCAFYTDCTHEVEEVTSGWRVVLQYDVYQEAKAHDSYSVERKEDETNMEKCDDEEDEYHKQELQRTLCDDWIWNQHSYLTKVEKLAIDMPRKDLEAAVINFLKTKNHNDRIAILLHHCYSLLSLEDYILKGTDSVVYNAFIPDKWNRKLQGILIRFESEYDVGGSEVDIIAISLDDFELVDHREQQQHDDATKDDVADKDDDDDEDKKGNMVNEKNEDNDHGTTYVVCYGKNPPGGKLLNKMDAIEYTGNESQNGRASFFNICMILSIK